MYMDRIKWVYKNIKYEMFGHVLRHNKMLFYRGLFVWVLFSIKVFYSQ